jgi:hypothetical protein
MDHTCYSKICLTIAIFHRGPSSISLCKLINPFLINPEPKIYIFSTYMLPNCFARCAYTCCSTTARVYQDLCQKIQNEVRFPCHDNRSLIFGLPYTGNVLTRPFSCIMEAIREQFRAMEKRRKHSTLRAKLL